MNRTLIILSLVAVSAAANAFSVNLVSAGNFTVDPADSNLVVQNEAVYVSQVGTLPTLTSVVVSSNYAPSPIVQTATYTGGSGTLTLNFAYQNTVVGDFGVSTDSGTWSYLSGTGSYANLSGAGSYAISYNVDANNFSTTQVVGNMEVVPEPASMVALSLGAAALLRRRRKA